MLRPLEISNASPRSRFQIGLGFNLLGAIFNQGSTFLFAIIAANLLGREVFGKYGMVGSTLVTLSQVAQLACGYTATKYVAEYRSSDKQKTGRIVGMLFVAISISAGIVALGLLASIPWMVNSILKAPELRIGLAVGSGVVFLNVLIGFFMGALAGLEAYRKLSLGLVRYGLFYLAACTLCTWRVGLNGAFAGLLVSALFGCILLYLAFQAECRNQGIKIRYGLFREERSILTKFALPAAISGLTFLPALWLGNAILARQPDGYNQLAAFSVAYSLMTAVLFVPSISNSVGWSLLNHHRGRGEQGQYRGTFLVNLLICAGCVLVGASALGALGPAILRLYGKSFADGHLVVLVMLGASIPQALALAALQHLQSQARVWFSFLIVILPRDLLLAVLAYRLIPRHGAVGLAVAYSVAWTFALITTAAIVLKSLHGEDKDVGLGMAQNLAPRY